MKTAAVRHPACSPVFRDREGKRQTLPDDGRELAFNRNNMVSEDCINSPNMAAGAEGVLMKPASVITRFFGGTLILLVSAVLWNCLFCNAFAQYSLKTKPGEVRVNNKDGLPYRWIPPTPPEGFLMGCSPGDRRCEFDETPHGVRLTKGFWMGETEVTVTAYQNVTQGKNPSPFKGDELPVVMSW